MSTRLTDSKIKEIRERAEKATEAPWHSPGLGEVHCSHEPEGREVYVRVYAEDDPRHGTDENIVADGCTGHDAEFIAHARADIPALLDHCTALEAELREQHEAISKVWTTLDITEYTGKHIAEHVAELQAELQEARAEIERLRNELEKWPTDYATEQVNEYCTKLVAAVQAGSDGVGGDFEVREIIKLIESTEPDNLMP